MAVPMTKIIERYLKINNKLPVISYQSYEMFQNRIQVFICTHCRSIRNKFNRGLFQKCNPLYKEVSRLRIRAFF